MTNLDSRFDAMCQKARQAYYILAVSSDAQRGAALRHAASALRGTKAGILAANAQDMAAAAEKGLSDAMCDRLRLDDARIEAMAGGLEAIAQQPDPLAGVLEESHQPNGLHIQRVPVPLGVIGMIYESRPNVTADAAGLCIKAGNAALLRGGSESQHSSAAIAGAMHQGLQQAGLPATCVQLMPDNGREWVAQMLNATGQIDVLIPRGGKSLTERVQRESRVPTLLHLDGNCHSYIHADADAEKAIKIVTNAKMRRTGICGATESLVIDASLAPSLLPRLVKALQQAGCEGFYGDEAALAICANIAAASDEDWGREYLGAEISIKIVADSEAAIAHINRYSSHHTDAIITENAEVAAQFMQRVDSAIVMHNTSTQFADGGEFGMGAEIGIATGRLHARGPVGAKQLVTYKYCVRSDGTTRAVG